jgi:L-aminopeptidase/D-esterase-like protein
MSEPASWFQIGHVTQAGDETGCTAILFDDLVPAAVDVRGGAPGTRETDLLSSGRLLNRADALLLTGGSAFGLAAADGVMRYLAERGRGFQTSVGTVPIVPAAVIFDLGTGTPRAPSAEDGYLAASNAGRAKDGAGRIGAGAGATVAKLGGPPSTPSGLSIATVATGQHNVTAVVVLNALGDVVDPSTGRSLARAHDSAGLGRSGRELAMQEHRTPRGGENTTIGAVLLDTPVDLDTLERACVAAHAALARCVVPSHTLFDGDTFFAASRTAGAVSTGTLLALTCAVELAVERAIVALFRVSATSV